MLSYARQEACRRHGDGARRQPAGRYEHQAAQPLLTLQRSAGNAAVVRALAALSREPSPLGDALRRGASPALGSGIRSSVICSLIPSAGNSFVANSWEPAVQRFPIATKDQLSTEADYTGGRHRKGTWAAVSSLLDAYATTPDPGLVEKILKAATAARGTFEDTKKVKRVGVDKATRQIIPALEHLLVDCHIQLLLFQIEAEAKLVSRPLDSASSLERLIKQVRSLLPKTVDNSGGQLDATLQQHEAGISHVVSGELIKTLGMLKYQPEHGRDNFWYPTDGDFSYALPHVSWKAHLTAGRVSQAVDVVRGAAPVLKRWGAQHKVDTNEEMFTTTRKLVTIYPPRQEGDWPGLISDLESAVGGQLQLPPGELPVGGVGRVGMRHGQITGLTSAILERETNTRFGPSNEKVDGYTVAELDPRGGARVWRTRFPSKLVISPQGVLHFYCPGIGARKAILQTAIFLDGCIRPDPREEANPYGTPLPRGVTQHRGY